MEKRVIIGIIAVVVLVTAVLFAVNLKKLEANDEKSSRLNIFQSGLGELCGEKECERFCEENTFACEVYCVKHPENKYCLDRFSFVYSAEGNSQYAGNPLVKFPEFRNYNYTFKDGKLQEEEPKIEHIGIEIDYYNSKENKAGDFVFDKFTYPWNLEIYNTKVFYDFGELVYDANGSIKKMPEATYIVPLGTKVKATTKGVITYIKEQDTGDYEFSIVKPESPSWTFGYDHVINLEIKEGDNVVAGQVLGEVSNYNQ
ncbi:MAG: M23 family metallopeptidase, partial [Nanoarchaeota archaeon]